MSNAPTPTPEFHEDAPHPARTALDALFRADAHARTLGIELVDWGLGWAEVRATAPATHGNFLGSLHGGYLFSLADVALSYAGNSWGRMSLALSMEIQYLRAAHPGAPLRAVARCRSRTRRTSAFAIDVTSGADTLVATLQAINYRTDAWHLNEETWPAEWRARF